MRFLKEWSKKNVIVEAVRRKDIHVQVRQLEDIFTRDLNVFIVGLSLP
jgi:hypothetical protein